MAAHVVELHRELQFRRDQPAKRRSQVDDARRAAVQLATQTWETLQAARAAIASFGAAVRAAQIALQGTQQEALVGSRTVLDVLTTEQDLLTSRVNLEIARHDALLAAYQVESQVGHLTAQALHLSTPIYNPKQHYDQVRDQWVGTEVTPNYGEKK